MTSQLDKIAELKTSYPDNLAIQCFDAGYYDSIDESLKKRLLACIRSGIENPSSEMGCYACQVDDYDTLRPFFSKVISQHHGITPHSRHISDWSIPSRENSTVEQSLDVDKFGQGPLSLRIRVGRNFSDLPLTSAMTRAECTMDEIGASELFSS